MKKFNSIHIETINQDGNMSGKSNRLCKIFTGQNQNNQQLISNFYVNFQSELKFRKLLVPLGLFML